MDPANRPCLYICALCDGHNRLRETMSNNNALLDPAVWAAAAKTLREHEAAQRAQVGERQQAKLRRAQAKARLLAAVRVRKNAMPVDDVWPPGRGECCSKKRCCQQFQPYQVAAWRSHLMCMVPERSERGSVAHSFQSSMLLPTGKPVCLAYCKWVMGLCNQNIYYKRVGGNKKRDLSTKDVSVIAWFEALKDTLDRMPDCDMYQVPAPYHSTVHDWYEEDVLSFPELYISCSPSHFRKSWLAFHKNIKLRKWLRFAKCGECERLREIRWNRATLPEARAAATTELFKHFQFIKEERAYALGTSCCAHTHHPPEARPNHSPSRVLLGCPTVTLPSLLQARQRKPSPGRLRCSPLP